MKGVLVSENLWKLIGVAVMAAIVAVGVVATSGEDSDFTRNAAFVKIGDIKGEFKNGGSRAYLSDGRNPGTLKLDVGPVNQPEFESERRNVVALGVDMVASVIVGDNHFRDVGDPASALKKLDGNMNSLIVDDKSLGVRGPLSKVVGDDSPTLAIQTDDGLTLGPISGEGVFISIQDEALIDVDTSEYTEVEWAYLQESLLEASENLVAMAKKLEVWTNGMATSLRTDGS